MPMKTTSTALFPAASAINELTAAAKRAALERWAGWALELADGGSMPAVADVMGAGLALGLADAIKALTDDASAIVKARRLEERIAGRERWRDELLNPHGGSFAALKEEIKRRRAELVELERVQSSLFWDSRLGSLKAQLLETKAAAPRVFPPAAPRRKAKTQKPAAASAEKPKRPTRKGKANPDAVEAV